MSGHSSCVFSLRWLDGKWLAMLNLILLSDIISLMSIENVCHLLFVNFQKRDPDFAVFSQIFSFVKFGIDVVHDTLNYALVSIFRHHVSCCLRHSRLSHRIDWIVMMAEHAHVWRAFLVKTTRFSAVLSGICIRVVDSPTLVLESARLCWCHIV